MASELVGGFLVEMRDGVFAEEALGVARAIAMLRPVIEVGVATEDDTRDLSHLIEVAHAKNILRGELAKNSGSDRSTIDFGRCKDVGQWVVVVLDALYYEDQAVHIQNAIGRIRGVTQVHPEMVGDGHSDAVGEIAAGLRRSVAALLE